MVEKRVIFIMGVGHSGSTLLELILGSHSKILGLGELANLQEKLDSGPPDSVRLCSICPDECEYWNDRADLQVLNKYFSNRKWYSTLVRQIYRQRKSIYQYFFDWFDAPILVDSSKRVSWIQRQLHPSLHWRKITPVLIYITRDGRAVVNSYLRKYAGTSIEVVSKNWKDNVERMEDFFRRFKGPKCMVSYESLAVKPYETTHWVTDFLGLRFEPEMLEYWTHEHHTCNGNLGTRSLIYRYRSQLGEASQAWDENMQQLKSAHGEFYDRVGLAIKLDLRWKRELTEKQLRVFEAIAGRTNRVYAYDHQPYLSRRVTNPWSLGSLG